MTTPEVALVPGSTTGLGVTEEAHSDLVARLVNEIYRQGNTAATPLLPTPPQLPQLPQAPASPGPILPNPHGAPSLPGVPTPGGDFANLSPATSLATRSGGVPAGLPGITGTVPADTSQLPSGPANPAVPSLSSVPSVVVPNPHGAPSAPGLPVPGGDAANLTSASGLSSRSGGVPAGLPGITGSAPADTSLLPSGPTSPSSAPWLPAGSDLPHQAYWAPAAVAAPHGSNARGHTDASDLYLPSVTEAAGRFPGGIDLHQAIAKDHPRANGFAHQLAPSLVPSQRPGHVKADPKTAREADIGQPASPPSGKQIRVVDHGGDEPHAASEYYFLATSPREAARAPASARTERYRAPLTGPSAPFDVDAVRSDFPALHQKVNGHPLVWLDNAATTHKPRSVIDITSEFYAKHNSNIHRAAHTLAARSTDLFEGAREKVARFLNAPSKDDIVFLRGTTEAINLVANSYGRANIGPGDEIIVSTIEHHANIVPWQLLSEATGAVLRVIPVNDRGEIIFEQFAALLSGRTKIVSVTHVANALGTINPVSEIIALSHAYGVPVLIDAAQSTPHLPVDVQALDADFVVFSGHKVFGPTGIGALYGKKQHLEAMPPWQGGGHMIEDVTFAKTTYRSAPEKFEAGTPDIAGAVGLGAAIDYMHKVGIPAISTYEHDLLEYAQAGLADVKGLRLIGTARAKASVMSFTIAGHENADVAQHLDRHGIAVRAGHHCALPALRRFGVDQSVRASLAFYNTREDVDVFLRALHALPRR